MGWRTSRHQNLGIQLTIIRAEYGHIRFTPTGMNHAEITHILPKWQSLQPINPSAGFRRTQWKFPQETRMLFGVLRRMRPVRSVSIGISVVIMNGVKFMVPHHRHRVPAIDQITHSLEHRPISRTTVDKISEEG